MRVLMLAWEYPPHIVGGMGKHVAELVPALDAAGVHVHVVSPLLRGGEPEERLGQHSQISRVATPTMPDYGFISFTQETNRYLEAHARQLAAQHGPFDLIHGHDWLTSYASVALKYAWRAPLLTTIHATERGRGRGRTEGDHAQTINGLEWWLAHESWRVLVCSEFMREQINQYFGTPLDKISVVANGVHIPQIEWSDDERQEFRRRYAADDERLVFSVARMVYEKGVQVLVEAIPRVLGQRNDVKFVIAGLGPTADQLQARTRTLFLDHRVFWTGFISDDERDKLYAVADAAVFPSLYEPFGIVALEAMAACCPVIVSDTGGLREVVQLNETGLTVFPDNPDSLAWGILQTLNHPDDAQRRANAAHEVVQRLYNWPTIAQETSAIYNHVWAEKATSAWATNQETDEQ